MLSCELCEISKNTFFIEHLWWLLLSCETTDIPHAQRSYIKNSCMFALVFRIQPSYYFVESVQKELERLET